MKRLIFILLGILLLLGLAALPAAAEERFSIFRHYYMEGQDHESRSCRERRT